MLKGCQDFIRRLGVFYSGFIRRFIEGLYEGGLYSAFHIPGGAENMVGEASRHSVKKERMQPDHRASRPPWARQEKDIKRCVEYASGE